MAEYTNLQAAIDAQIRANGVQAITGPVLNAVLTAMKTVLGDGYRLQGVAAPADNPGAPDNRVAYLASKDGTYTNFGGLTLAGEVAVLCWDSAWTKQTLLTIDAAPAPGSPNPISSDAVDAAIAALASVYMALVPSAVEDNLASFDNAGQVKDSGIAAGDVVLNGGSYADLFSGFTANLVDTRSNGTPQSFIFRQSGGDGVNYLRRIKGKTIAWNQLADLTRLPASISAGGATLTKNADGSITIAAASALAADVALDTRYSTVDSGWDYPGHTYFIKATGNALIQFRVYKNNGYGAGVVKDTSVLVALSGTDRLTGYGFIAKAGFVGSVTFVPTLVDLTLLGLGSLTVAQFEALYNKKGYAVNAGVLKNNAATALVTRGFNAWDEVTEEGDISIYTGQNSSAPGQLCAKNYIPALPSTTYYIKSANVNVSVIFYDADKAFISSTYGIKDTTFVTPAGTAFIRFALYPAYGATYNHDINLNISNASRNGTYEPYWKRTRQINLHDFNVEQGGVEQTVHGLNSAGTSPVVYDEILDGKKYICRVGTRPYQAGDENDPTLTTDGTNTNYPLTTPQEYNLVAPFAPYVEVDELGTEEATYPADTTPFAPFESDSNYSISVANLTRALRP